MALHKAISIIIDNAGSIEAVCRHASFLSEGELDVLCASTL